MPTPKRATKPDERVAKRATFREQFAAIAQLVVDLINDTPVRDLRDADWGLSAPFRALAQRVLDAEHREATVADRRDRRLRAASQLEESKRVLRRLAPDTYDDDGPKPAKQRADEMRARLTGR